MPIIIDLTGAQPYKNVKYHGGGEYSKQFLGFLLKSFPHQETTCILYYGKDIDKHIQNFIDAHKLKAVLSHSLEETRDILETFDQTNNVIVLPMPYHLHNGTFTLKKAKVVCTIHGLRSWELPKVPHSYRHKEHVIAKLKSYIYHNLPTSLLLAKAEEKYRSIFSLFSDTSRVLILTDSYFSLESLKDLLQSDFDKYSIFVAYPLVDTGKLGRQRGELVKGKYILLVNANRPEKNVLPYLDSLVLISNFLKKHYYTVALTGVDDYLREYINSHYEVLREHLQLFDYVPKEDLELLYQYATLFAFPSLNEGFGIPIIEAMKYNVKIVASRVTSIPEIGMDCIYYLNPYSKTDMANNTLRALKSDSKVSYQKALDRISVETHEQWKKVSNFIASKD